MNSFIKQKNNLLKKYKTLSIPVIFVQQLIMLIVSLLAIPCGVNLKLIDRFSLV